MIKKYDERCNKCDATIYCNLAPKSSGSDNNFMNASYRLKVIKNPYSSRMNNSSRSKAYQC